MKIVDPAVWQENMRYVLSVTGENRTRAAAFEAYMNDRRSQGYSVIDGMGPLADWYREGAGATTTINHTLADFDPNEVITRKEDDKGTEAGAADSELKDFVAFMKVIRGPEGTTSPAKYFYSTPRPWRMNDKGEVIETGKETIGDRSFESHDSDPGVIVPALKYARENRGRSKDGGFPSGHTNAAYLAAIAYAYAVPERFSELLTAASELGESRIVAGMHSPLDVIGGRITATAMAAAMLQDPKNAEVKKAAHAALQAYFAKRLPQGQSLIDFAHGAKPDVDRFADTAKNGSDYRRRMTFSFSRDKAVGDAPMMVPKGPRFCWKRACLILMPQSGVPFCFPPASRRVIRCSMTAMAGVASIWWPPPVVMVRLMAMSKSRWMPPPEASTRQTAGRTTLPGQGVSSNPVAER
nr:phosphatase PAP2 family protein [Rhizobium oryzihabitans]